MVTNRARTAAATFNYQTDTLWSTAKSASLIEVDSSPIYRGLSRRSLSRALKSRTL